MVDRLHEDGTFTIVLTSPPKGTAGEMWLGIQVPPLKTTVRFEVDAASLKTTPDRCDGGGFDFYCEGPDDLGVEFISKLFWKTTCTKVIPLIASQLPRFAGSEMDNDFRDGGALAPLRPAVLHAEANLRSSLESRR
eukprot:NODE_8068_length_1526_cov_2.364546.p2 GENE.NODE_8068_length_1526_cov_2.364546~~NODE_8068_length_1526_cov_2.364546.p2  ORF type:complete len:136 (+),score=34.32 NODE_8068_length_1526_cov_2.364546:855-1262(+)